MSRTGLYGIFEKLTIYFILLSAFTVYSSGDRLDEYKKGWGDFPHLELERVAMAIQLLKKRGVYSITADESGL